MKSARFYLIKLFHLFLLYTISFGAYLFSIGKKKKLPPIRNPILLKSATQLAEEIRKCKLKSVQVIHVYIERIKEVEPYLNAVVENRFLEALDEARAVDTLLNSGLYDEEQLEREKPLLGVPFTVKVILSVKDMRTTGGSIVLQDKIGEEDAITVTLLKEAGGIVLATTNCSEFGCSLESNNFVHGRSNNPYDTSRTCGGSSGGEAALLGAGASVIGLGNDLLGSVRIPSQFCGVFGHKPSLGLVSNAGSVPQPHPSSEYFLFTGPMCRYAEDLELTMRLLTSESKEKFIPRDPDDFSRLKIYYQTELDNPWILKPDEEILEAFKKAIYHFTDTYGCTVEEVNIPNLNKANSICLHLLQEKVPNVMAHATYGRITHINGFLELFKSFLGLSSYTFMAILAGYFGKLFPIYNELLPPYYKMINNKLIESFDHLLDENSVFLCPSFPSVAPHHYGALPYVFSLAYTCVFNSTGLPATQCPMGFTKKGLPIGIQIVSKRNNDGLTIACAKELEKTFGGWIPPDKVQNIKKEKLR